MSAVREITVDLGDRSYPVLVGDGARHSLGQVVPPGAKRAAVVTQEAVGVEVETGTEQRTFLIGEGEQAKSMSTVEDLCRGFARFGLTRADLVVGVGGGVVTDVAGFAAAVYHRGVAVAHVATTLLAQVDAAIGGKSGVNLPEGKNLVGAFWQPVAVICDTEVLATLPPREYRSGLGEMAKYAFLGAPDLAQLDLDAAVARSVELKAILVAARRTGDGQPGRRGAAQWPRPAQLRSHSGSRPRDGRPIRLAARGGRGHRARICRPAGPPVGPSGRRTGGGPRQSGGRLRPPVPTSRRGRPGGAGRGDGAGQESYGRRADFRPRWPGRARGRARRAG